MYDWLQKVEKSMDIGKMKKIPDRNKERITLSIKGFLTAYALTAQFHTPFSRAHYETGIDYVIASIYELLGDYSFSLLLIWGLSILFLKWIKEKAVCPTKPVSSWLAVLFSLFLLMGRSYQETGSWGFCFGSPVNFLKSLLALAGYSILLSGILNVFTAFLEKHAFTRKEENFWSAHSFGKAFAILCAAYFPFLLLAFPGNVCWDAVGQIQQVICQTGYSLHHPLFHTLLMGGLTEWGKRLLGSYEAGLFCYMLIQLAALAAALASTIAVLAKRNMKRGLLWGLLALYSITPVYSNMASTALKDVPYSSAMAGYVVCLALITERPERLRKARLTVSFFALQLLVILLRNNGIYVILLGGTGIFLVLLRQYGWKTVGRRLLGLLMGSAVAGIFLMQTLTLACDAQAGSRGEMLSLPFQQTARYLQRYEEEASQEEKAAIEAVLGNPHELAGKYNLASADPVKACFRKDAFGGELLTYLKYWGYGFVRHPGVYMEALFAHAYGWFTPELNNSLRYEAEHNLLRRGGLFPNAEKLLIFYYRFAARFTPLGALENIGLAVWALFFMVFYQRKHGQTRQSLASLPLWVSLLICVASPGFMGHARYAFPILFTIPFLYGFMVTANETEGVREP